MYSRAIFALLSEKSSMEQLISIYSNIFIKDTKTIDVRVIGVKVLKYWQRLKVHRMLLEKYLNVKRST